MPSRIAGTDEATEASDGQPVAHRPSRSILVSD